LGGQESREQAGERSSSSSRPGKPHRSAAQRDSLIRQARRNWKKVRENASDLSGTNARPEDAPGKKHLVWGECHHNPGKTHELGPKRKRAKRPGDELPLKQTGAPERGALTSRRTRRTVKNNKRGGRRGGARRGLSGGHREQFTVMKCAAGCGHPFSKERHDLVDVREELARRK